MSRFTTQRLGIALLALVTVAVIVPIILVIGVIVVEGLPAIHAEFLFSAPRNGMREGGIWPAIVGTFWLTVGTAIFSVPLGVAIAIYLSEYARDNKFTRSIRLAIINLAGVPSIVYGLFGLGLFVLALGFGSSVLGGSVTLAVMTPPGVLINT